MKQLHHKLSLFDSPDFAEKFHCDLPLGALCGQEKTIFRLWAPTAQQVTLRLYENGNDCDSFEEIPMTPCPRDTWEHCLSGYHSGLYYDYAVTVEGITQSTADPYARACGVNGQRSMVIDLSATDPKDWNEDKAPARPAEDIIYEIHVKDFSWDTASGVLPKWRGKFKALCQTGTTLNHIGIHPTLIDYLKRLGVTHIQLMPVYDYGSVDESGEDTQFNWGYDPVNYNVPEGSYSTDPYHGEVRIRELKEAIQSLHKNGFRVIMDVVYNHTHRLDSWLHRTVPWYYHRRNGDGTPSNGSGCGNDIAAERSMAAQYILESVLYWAEEYHMDGFRFDLMGLLDVELMNRIRSALDERYGVGEKLVFGEPWSAGPTACIPETRLALKGNLTALHPGVGAFCDATRDAVKGDLMHIDGRGFVNGGGMDAETLRHCLIGWVDAPGDFSVAAPSQTISYLSSHDDWTLWDRLVYTMDEKQDFEGYQPNILRANRMAAAINACCQGHLFQLSGEEFGRTKLGIRDSYCSSVTINRMDWNRAWKNRALVDYYQGLYALRKQIPAFCDKDADAARHILSVEQLAEDACMALIENEGGSWSRLCLLFNAGAQEQSVRIPDGTWKVLADIDSSFRWQEEQTAQEEMILSPVSVLFLGKMS